MKKYNIHLVSSNRLSNFKDLLEEINNYEGQKVEVSVSKWNYSFLALNYFLTNEMTEEPDIMLIFDNAEFSRIDGATGKNIGYRKMLDAIRSAKVNLQKSRIVVILSPDKEEDKGLISEMIKLDIQNFYFADSDKLDMGEIKKWLFGHEKSLEDNKKYLIEAEREEIQTVIKYVDRIVEKPVIHTEVVEKIVEKGEPRIIEKEIITEKIKGTLFLTFAGADYNIGCTHAACSTAYYLSRQGYKTAYLEMCDDPVFFKGYKDDSTVKEIEGGYTVEKNLDLYVKYLNGNVEYGKAVSNGYQYIVVDVGCIFKRNKKGVLETNENIKEMERATISVLVGAGSKWQLSNIVEAAKLGHDNWKLYINFTDNDIEKAIIKTISKMTNKEVYLAPYTPNCFKKYSEQDEFLEILLKDILPAKIIKKPGIVNRIFSKKIRR